MKSSSSFFFNTLENKMSNLFQNASDAPGFGKQPGLCGRRKQQRDAQTIPLAPDANTIVFCVLAVGGAREN